MRFIRNLLLTLIFMAAVGAAALFGYYRFRGGREIALINEGIALMEQGNYRSARQKFADAQQFENSITRRLSDDTLEEDLYRYAAICDFRLGEYEEAAYIFDKLLVLHPRDSSLLSSRASVYAATGNMEEAETLFDTAIAIDKSNYTRIYTAALTLREYGNEEAGARYFQKLLAEHEKDLDPVIKGQALCFLKQYEEGIKVLGSIENPDMQTSFLLAGAWEQTGAHKRALKILEEFEEQIVNYPDMLNLKGTAFRKAVWKILLTIPYGRTMTYGEVAAKIAEQQGRARMSAQAVGGAASRNPVALIVPCHRVIGSDGSLTGYAAGTDRKRRLLEMEKVLLDTAERP